MAEQRHKGDTHNPPAREPHQRERPLRRNSANVSPPSYRLRMGTPYTAGEIHRGRPEDRRYETFSATDLAWRKSSKESLPPVLESVPDMLNPPKWCAPTMAPVH